MRMLTFLWRSPADRRNTTVEVEIPADQKAFPLAEVAKKIAEKEGVPASKLWICEQSGNSRITTNSDQQHKFTEEQLEDEDAGIHVDFDVLWAHNPNQPPSSGKAASSSKKTDKKKDEEEKEIKEKKVNNKVTINPKLGEEVVSELGGTLIEMVEYDEFDGMVEGVYFELQEEGYGQDDIEEALEWVLTEVRVTYGSDTESPRQQMMKKANMKTRKKLTNANMTAATCS